jgi:hypothetical protein
LLSVLEKIRIRNLKSTSLLSFVENYWLWNQKKHGPLLSFRENYD